MNNGFEKHTFRSNQTIFWEGEHGEAAYLILSGKVEIRMRARSDNPQRIGVLNRGDVFGEMSLFDNQPHMATAIALKETVVTTISKIEFDARVSEMDPIMRGIVNLMVKRARNMAEDLIEARDPGP